MCIALLLGAGTMALHAQSVALPGDATIYYIHLLDGRVVAFPESYISCPVEPEEGVYTVTDNAGHAYTFQEADVDFVSTETPDLPAFTAFKINAKQNDMLTMDATGTIGDREIAIEVGGIGKRLIPNFSTSASTDEVYVDRKLQVSKETDQRFDRPVVYTVTRPGWSILRLQTNGSYAMQPLGSEYTVNATFLSDNPTTPYGIPVVNIYTEDNRIITSKEEYKNATITIDGAGYYPDMASTPVLIRGRGNTSWSTPSVDADGNPTRNPKNPYRLKFDTKVPPLGLKKGKSWCLIAQSQYRSMLTNPIGQRIAEMVGTAFPNHFIPVELYVNGDYRGQYCFTEKVGFSNNSIDLSDDTNAALIELDSYYDEVYKFRTTRYRLPANIKEPDLADTTVSLTQAQIQTNFNRITDAAYVQGNLSDIVDTYYLARFLMVTDLIYNQEFFHPKSTYCYIENVLDPEAKWVFGPIWDLDWAFGYEEARNYYTVDQNKDFWTQNTVHDGETQGFIRNLRYSGEEINREYYRVWHNWKYKQLPAILEYLDDYYAVTRRSFVHDKSKWNQGGEGTYLTLTNNCKTWLSQRTDFVYNYLTNTLGYGDTDYLGWATDLEDAEREFTYSGPAAYPAGTYDLLGRRVSDDWSTLAPGVYIVNGQKRMK